MDHVQGIDLYENLSLTTQEVGAQNSYQFENESGSGAVTIYQVFPGIELIYNDIHMTHYAPRETIAPWAIEINHCRLGRFECVYDRDSFCYIAQGDLAITALSHHKTASYFPTGHYHGISILLDAPRFDERLEGIFSSLAIDMEAVCSLASSGQIFVMRAKPATEHIFSELYSVREQRKAGYMKLKVLESLLFLSNLRENTDGEQRPVFPAHHVRAVKAIRDYITEDASRKFTLEELSRRFDIPLTAMKKAFRVVYGASIYDYFRSWRLEMGAELLRDSDSSITAIAQRVGYENPSKFTSAFHQKTGMSPFQYRKSVRLDKK